MGPGLASCGSPVQTRWVKVLPTELEEADELDVPPAIACAACGRQDCMGTCAVVRLTPTDLPWENDESTWVARLWRTAEMTALEPDFVFGRLARGRLGAAFGFALVCESLALASLGAVASVAFGVLWPEPFVDGLRSPFVWTMVLAAWVVTTVGMLLIHVLWGACMEFGAKLAGVEADHQRGFRFGMYSTGWDLLTSPAGIALSLVFRGWSSFVEPLRVAARIPRKAVDAYLVDCRGFDARTRRRAMQVTVAAFAAMFVVGLLLAAWGFVHWLRSLLA